MGEISDSVVGFGKPDETSVRSVNPAKVPISTETKLPDKIFVK